MSSPSTVRSTPSQTLHNVYGTVQRCASTDAAKQDSSSPSSDNSSSPGTSKTISPASSSSTGTNGEAPGPIFKPRMNANGQITAYGVPLPDRTVGRPTKLFSEKFYQHFLEGRVAWPEGYPVVPTHPDDRPYREGDLPMPIRGAEVVDQPPKEKKRRLDTASQAHPEAQRQPLLLLLAPRPTLEEAFGATEVVDQPPKEKKRRLDTASQASPEAQRQLLLRLTPRPTLEEALRSTAKATASPPRMLPAAPKVVVPEPRVTPVPGVWTLVLKTPSNMDELKAHPCRILKQSGLAYGDVFGKSGSAPAMAWLTNIWIPSDEITEAEAREIWARLYEDRDRSLDIILYCGIELNKDQGEGHATPPSPPRSIPAHTLVLKKHSIFFEKLLKGWTSDKLHSHMMEQVEVAEKPHVLEAIVRHLYEQPYIRQGNDNSEQPMPLKHHLDIFNAASILGMDRLQSEVVAYYEQFCVDGWKLWKRKNALKEFVSIAERIFKDEKYDRQKRLFRIFKDFAFESVDELMHFANFQTYMATCGKVGRDFMWRVWERRSIPRHTVFKCGSCSRYFCQADACPHCLGLLENAQMGMYIDCLHRARDAVEKKREAVVMVQCQSQDCRSWMPKKVFEEANRLWEGGCMDCGTYRSDWNDLPVQTLSICGQHPREALTWGPDQLHPLPQQILDLIPRRHIRDPTIEPDEELTYINPSWLQLRSKEPLLP